MVLDTSALVAVLQDEPERSRFIRLIDAADACRLSAATLVETSIVIEERFGAEGARDLDLFLSRAGVETVSVDAEQAQRARHAFSRFGRGRHPAGLNVGDCFSYALATSLSEPLLFKGRDFALTDVSQVLDLEE